MTFRNRLCLVTDIVAYSGHTIPERADAERRLFAVQQFALARARAFRVRPLRREDRGDGQLLLLPPTLDASTAIPALVAGLRHGLFLANADQGPFGQLRIRVSMAQGAISEQGPLGPRGDALITACRLNDAEPFKAALARDTSADLGFIVPDDLYRDVIRHDFGSLRSSEFRQVKINVKEYEATAWMYLPPSGPAPELTSPAESSMWQTAAAGGLIAGLAVVAVSATPPLAIPEQHPDPCADGSASQGGWSGDELVGVVVPGVPHELPDTWHGYGHTEDTVTTYDAPSHPGMNTPTGDGYGYKWPADESDSTLGGDQGGDYPADQAGWWPS